MIASCGYSDADVADATSGYLIRFYGYDVLSGHDVKQKFRRQLKRVGAVHYIYLRVLFLSLAIGVK